jgi:hypothetical protein
MFFATNLLEIQVAMDSKAPRPIEEVLLEYYPDCTIDRNGRAHAPYDGYECQFTGKQFRAGEYLPFELSEEVIQKNKRPWTLWVFCDRKIHSFEGTKKQFLVGMDVCKKQTFSHDLQTTHVGIEKFKLLLDLVLLSRYTDVGTYGNSYTHYFRDQDNNSVVYKGSNCLQCDFGKEYEIQCTVKKHWTSMDGRKATYISRAKVTK